MFYLHVPVAANLVTARYPDRYKVGGPSTRTSWPVILTFDYSLVDWIGFLTLNIGNPAVEAVPTGTRIFIGLLQAISVRNAGFQVVPLAVVTPAVKCVPLCSSPCRDDDVNKGFVPRHDVHRHLPHRVEVRLRRSIEDPFHVHRRLTRAVFDRPTFTRNSPWGFFMRMIGTLKVIPE